MNPVQLAKGQDVVAARVGQVGPSDLWAQGDDDFDVYSRRKQFVPDFQRADRRTFDHDMTELVSSDVKAPITPPSGSIPPPPYFPGIERIPPCCGSSEDFVHKG